MPQDVRIKPDEYGLFDLVLDGADFEAVDGLESSIAVSLFTDGRAEAGRVQDPKKRRGWIGDIFKVADSRTIGSELWILDQERLTSKTINDARIFATDSLQWLIDDGIAQTVNVNVIKTNVRTITIAVELTKTSGQTLNYDFIWRSTDVNNITNS
ncbi:MAG: hypothetical protein GY746_00175 [Gammaproteobacteria bacterium]|nr:hypothetical protein [Gammaproteobacteria bacterium]MCP4488150.1 hypothetical protein [Gammaproteobacteria bacterium]